MAPATVSMRALLRNNTAFVWSPECEVEFKQMKAVLSDEQFIWPFDPDLDTELLVDTSKVSGCGYILLQRTQDGSIHIIRCGSMAAKRGWAGMSPMESEWKVHVRLESAPLERQKSPDGLQDRTLLDSGETADGSGCAG